MTNTTWIIDDDRLQVYGIKRIMKYVNFCDDIESFSNGFDALTELKLIQTGSSKNPFPNVIILDINMPILNGWEFIEMLNELRMTMDFHLYVLSSYTIESIQKKAKEFDIISGVYTKPLTVEILQEIQKDIA